MGVKNKSMTEEQKQKMAEGRAKAKENVPKSELEQFKEETNKKIDKILGAVEGLLNKDERPDILPEKVEEEESEIAKLTPKQREIFEHYFDPTDGFEAWYDINKNIFTINVPMKMSNTTPAYQSYYKQDLRSKKVDPNDILGSIKKWCELVAQNLKYERRIRLK